MPKKSIAQVSAAEASVAASELPKKNLTPRLIDKEALGGFHR